MIDDEDRQLAEQYKLRRAARRAAARRRTIVSTVAVVVVAGLIAVLFWQVIKRQPQEVSGVVRCLSGAPVQGIYVKEARGAGSFAHPEHQPGNASVASFTTEIRGSRTYGVNIGCGPLNAPKWTHNVNSGYVSRGYHEFDCHDDPKDPLFEKCVATK